MQRTYHRDASKPNTLILTSSPIPKQENLRPHEVLIRVHAISLNYRDVNILNGTNPWPTLANGIPCSDATGTILSTGPLATKFRPGDRVSPIFDLKNLTGQEQEREWLGGEVNGILSTHVIFHEEKLVKVPEHLSWAEGACLPNAGVTGWSALKGVDGGLSEGEGRTILIQGTGGVSLLSLTLALAANHSIILTSSSSIKLQKVLEIAGPLHSSRIKTINYTTFPNWTEEVLRLNNGVGVDLVIENGGTSSLLKSINATRKGGVVSQVGYLGKQDHGDLEGLLEVLIDRCVTLRGINVGSRLDFEAMNRFISEKKISFEGIIDRRFKFDEVEEAFGYLKAQKHVGKVIIEID